MTDIGESAWDHGEPKVIEVYNFDDRLGFIAVGRTIRACDPNGTELGKFTSIEEVRREVVRAAYGGRPTP